MSGKIKGTVIQIGEIIESENTDVLKIVIEYEAGNYIKELEIAFFSDKIIDYILDELQIDDLVEVDFNVESRLSKNGNYFTNCAGWRINIIDEIATKKRGKERVRGKEIEGKGGNKTRLRDDDLDDNTDGENNKRTRGVRRKSRNR